MIHGDHLFHHYVTAMRSPTTDLLPDPPPAEPGPDPRLALPINSSASRAYQTAKKKARVRLPVPANALLSPIPSPSELDSTASDIVYYSHPASCKNDIPFIALTPVQWL